MRKWRWAGLGLLVLGGASLAVYLKLRPNPHGFALIGPTPFPLDVIPRTTMFEKPVISTKLPLVGKIEIPRRPIPPEDFVDSPLISGILTPQDTGTPKDIEAQLWLLAVLSFDEQ